MGCAASRIDKEEKVQVCKERKRLMKQLMGFRGEFADAQLAYSRALKNTGVTLRQFTESESLELENTTYREALPPSPPPTLPPSPPPPPRFSPDLRKPDQKREVNDEEESFEIDGLDDECATPPPLIPSSAWGSWDPFESLSHPPHYSDGSKDIEHNGDQVVDQCEEENWAEANSEFDDEEKQDEAVSGIVVNTLHLKLQPGEVIDDNSSTSWYVKTADNMPMVDSRAKKTLEGVVRELDDYFLKASACEKEIAVFMDICSRDSTLPQKFKENKRKRSNSARVFSAFSWSWSSKSVQLARYSTESSSRVPCRPGAHCTTLEKLYVAEKKLYEEVRNEAITKIELEKKSTLLRKQDEENDDWTKTEKVRLCVESLEAEIRRLQHSISLTCSSVCKLIDEELYPQLVAFISGLSHMWKTMHKCHQVQSHISQQLNHLNDFPSMDLSSEYRRQAAFQLETEVAYWFDSFCKLVKSQQEYARTICQWIQLTDRLMAEDRRQSDFSEAAHRLSEKWQLVFERLPIKVASEAIRSFLSNIQSIIKQQAEQSSLQRKSDKLEKRLQKELQSLDEMEMKLEESFTLEDASSNSNSKHPLFVKRAKTEALKKRLEIEKTKHLNSVQVTKTMTLNNLKTSLPNVFRALTDFASAFSRGFEAVQGCAMQVGHDASQDCDASQTEEGLDLTRS